MKNLSEYPTKETDNADYVVSHDGTGYIDSEVCASLERRLAACREALELALEVMSDEGLCDNPDCTEPFCRHAICIAQETLTATANP